MELQEILAEGDFSIWRELAEAIAARRQIKVVQDPNTCLVMMKAKDSVGQTPFYLGEVIISEASVTVNGVKGFGFALEDEPAKALCFAIIDGALAAGVPEEGEILQAVQREEKRLLEHRKREADLIAGTRVRFDIMEG